MKRLLLVGWDWVPCTAATSGLLYQPQMIGEGDCGAIGGMKIGRGNRSTQRKPAPAPLCPPKIPFDQTRDRTQAAAVGSQWLTAWAMVWPWFLVSICLIVNVSDIKKEAKIYSKKVLRMAKLYKDLLYGMHPVVCHDIANEAVYFTIISMNVITIRLLCKGVLLHVSTFKRSSGVLTRIQS
jgi:hypothetical protein